MECPDCDLDVLVEDGKASPHLRPADLTPCDAKPAEQDTPHKAPAKKTAPKAAGKD